MIIKKKDNKMDKMTGPDRKSNIKVRSFGDPNRNKGWIKCYTNKNRKKPYFFNVFTRCATWTLPISKDIYLPTHKCNLKKTNELETIEDMPLFSLSDFEDDNNKEILSNIKHGSKTKVDKDILFKLYFNTKINLSQNIVDSYDDEEEEEQHVDNENNENYPVVIASRDISELSDIIDHLEINYSMIQQQYHQMIL
ncbi:uncharacterized protein LOC122859757 [Aphidius gifuensis]|uniref:uncharacterized protein LOC122859757 n=1 Tax=Aphidius gifuensis TaxID=684658 RepID=UPI001CDC4FBC|nr:uncharacterized protein LOC122859757 [Aphidius gifuensis]